MNRSVPDPDPGDSSRPPLCIVVVSYNTCDLTLEAVRSAHAETQTPFEMIVVDNASTDGSVAAIAAEFPDVQVVALDENVGFAVGNNVGARDAVGEFLLLLNPDTVVLDGAIDELVAFARRRPEARIWGGRTVFADGSLNPKSCWRRLNLWRACCRTSGLDVRFTDSEFFNSEAYGGWQRDSERDVDIVSGCFFLIETALWHELGGFDPTYVMYGEEADLCLRAADRGAKPRITPTAEIVHHGGASEPVRSQKHVKLLRATISLARRHRGSMGVDPDGIGDPTLAALEVPRRLARRARSAQLLGAPDAQCMGRSLATAT
jgi:GT2 family glycosyltransferase